jgi:hypothetical protein
MQKLKVIWNYTGKYPTTSHYWRGDMDGHKRVALCGRKIPHSGDDLTCPQNELPECKDCQAIYRQYEERRRK